MGDWAEQQSTEKWYIRRICTKAFFGYKLRIRKLFSDKYIRKRIRTMYFGYKSKCISDIILGFHEEDRGRGSIISETFCSDMKEEGGKLEGESMTHNSQNQN